MWFHVYIFTLILYNILRIAAMHSLNNFFLSDKTVRYKQKFEMKWKGLTLSWNIQVSKIQFVGKEKYRRLYPVFVSQLTN